MPRIQFRRGKKAFWESENPTLYSGEPGLEVDTHKWKLGDGSTPWLALSYESDFGADIPVDQASLGEHINALEPHPVYDDGPDLSLLYQNAKV